MLQKFIKNSFSKNIIYKFITAGIPAVVICICTHYIGIFIDKNTTVINSYNENQIKMSYTIDNISKNLEKIKLDKDEVNEKLDSLNDIVIKNTEDLKNIRRDYDNFSTPKK